MDGLPRRATVYVSLNPGEDTPPLEIQLAEALRDAREQGCEIVRVAGLVAGLLNETRRGQVARLFRQLRAGAFPASITFGPTDPRALGFLGQQPTDMRFLRQQARAHGFSLTVGPTHATITTPALLRATAPADDQSVAPG